MKRDNLVKKLRKKVLPWFMAGAVLFGSYRCADNFVEPEPEPKNPVAVLTANPTSGDAPLEVILNGGDSYALEGYLKEYRWDVDGDGDIDSITSQSWITHIYENAGKFYPSLIVVDSKNRESNEDSLEIIVNESIIPLGTIAFWSNRDVLEGGYNEDIYSGNIVLRVKDNNIELRNIERLTIDPGQDLEPAWSPDGTEILFTSHRTGGTAVWRMNADGTNQRDITSHLVERARQAHWCSNGKIAVSYGLGDGIGIIDPDENSFIPIYSGSGAGPKWSPDCSEIAFQTYVNANWEIFLMNADGSKPRNLTNHSAIDGQPVWLPDGSGIIFSSDRANPYQAPIENDLYLMNSDGSNVTRLTYASGGEVDPKISQNGKYLLFSSFRNMEDPFQLYLTELINADDINKWIQLTTKGQNRYPAWRPKKED